MSTDRGLRYYITIDGYGDLELPSELLPEKQLLDTDVDAEGESYRYTRQPFAGLPTQTNRYRFPLPYPTASDSMISTLRELQDESGQLLMSHWKPINPKYIATEGQVSFYLPRRRRNAASSLSKSETTFPATVELNGVAQTVTMVAGPTVTTPSSGACNFSRTAATSGATKGYVEFRLAACTAGDIVRVQFWPAFIVRVVAAGEGYAGGFRESRDIAFLER